MSDTSVSIVVPTYNRRSSLLRLLEALSRQTYPTAQFEVIIVDDGSTDGTLDSIHGAETKLTLRLLQQTHAGPAAARNRGVAAARSNLVLFLDDDVVPAPDLIDEHVRTHERQPDAAVIGPMSPPGDWPRPIWLRWEESKLEKQYSAMVEGAWSCTARQFYTGNASLPRTRIIEAGGFDAAFQRAEDVELAYRLADNGVRFLFNPRADVLHYASRSFESWQRTPYLYGRYDVAMQRDKGRQTLDWAMREFHSRNSLTRMLVYLCTGRKSVVSLAVRGFAAAVYLTSKIGAQHAAGHALSALFSLLYWQGVCEEMGTRRQLWRSIAAAAPQP